jgi:hypothetical protein
MTELSIEFPPGVTTLLSRAAKIANWRDSNLVRWDDGKTLRPVGGWEEVPYGATPFASRLRAMHKWMTNAGIFYIAYLCDQHCYVDIGGVLFNITPLGGMAPPSGDVAGYGELAYGTGTYGTPRPGVSTLLKFAPAWTVSNWGENLVVMTSYDGRLLQWVPNLSGTGHLAVVATAPTNNRQFLVTPERHLMLFGMNGNQGDFGWCSQENINDWDFASTLNTAGMYTVDPLSPIVAAQISDVGITVHTPAMTHFVDYIGLPYIYRNRPIGKVPIPLSPASVTTIPVGIAWASVEGFWLFNGTTADIIPCPIWDSVAARMDFGRTVRESNIINILNRGEAWWFWVDPLYGTTVNRYIALDYRSNLWMSGYLSRTCGVSYANDRNPYMSDGVKVWKHETGFFYPGARFMPFIESQTLNVSAGAQWMTLKKLMPDIAGEAMALAFSVSKNNNRVDYGEQSYSPQRTINDFGYVDIRETARDMRLRIDMIASMDWSTIGPIIFDIVPRGKKP